MRQCTEFGISKKEYAKTYHSIKFMMTDDTLWTPEIKRLYLCLFTDIDPIRNRSHIQMKLFCACMYLDRHDLANRLLKDDNDNEVRKELIEYIRSSKKEGDTN